MTKYLQIDIDLLNIESSFFNDICYGSVLLNGKNLNLQERIEKLFLNYSVCDINCIYDKANIQKKTISCNCTSLLNIESKIEEPKFKQKTLSYSQYSSLNIIKCYHIFFLSTLKTFGFWILLFLLIIRLYFYICFFKNGINQINNYVETEIKKYQYNIEEKERASNDDGHNKKKHEIVTSEDIKIDNVEQNDITENEPKKNEIYTYTYIKNSNSRDDMIGEEEIENKKTNKNFINNLDNEQKIENKNDNEFYNDNTNNNKTITKKDNKNGVEKENGTINDNNDNNNNNDNIGNNNDNVNDGEIIPLIKFNANNTSRNKQPNDSKYELDNYDFDFSIKYEKRSFTKLFKIIFINNDFNKAFFFKSSLYLKQIYRIKFFISINEEILFNTLLEDLNYNGNNKFLSF